MGTRSTIKFYEGNDPLLSVYTQYDGYISGVGRDLANFLKDIKVVNGYGSKDTIFNAANGMGCLAAQYLARFKDSIGNVYVTTPDDNQEYNYEVRLIKTSEQGRFIETFKIVVKELGTGFEGTPEELLNFKESTEDAEF